MRTSVLVLLLLVIGVATASAQRDERVRPVTDPVVKKECGSCHMTFSPQFLPRRSWQKIVDTLSDHFGENASLGEAQRKAVLDYLLANAADSPNGGREGRRFTESITSGQTPLRITEIPRWVREHREVRADRWKSPERQVKGELPCVSQEGRAGYL